jgi:hypothetical protein
MFYKKKAYYNKIWIKWLIFYSKVIQIILKYIQKIQEINNQSKLKIVIF